MNLGNLRTLLRESILNDRTDRTSGTSDYLWTDATLNTFINEAQRRLAVQGLILRDGSTNDATRVTMVAGQSEYELHSSVIAVISCKQESAANDMQRVSNPILNMSRPLPQTWAEAINSSTLAAGTPQLCATDEELSADANGSWGNIMLRVYPTPAAADAGDYLRLRVVRKPLATLTADANVPEVPEDHHIELLDYAAYLALRIVDDDAGAPKRAQEFLDRFDRTVSEARRSAMRKLFAPMGIAFGRAGYSWEH